jgi:hypothetical protein
MFFLLWLVRGDVHGQAIVFDQHAGPLWKHTIKLNIETGQRVFSQETGYQWRVSGRKDWHHWQHFPTYSVSLFHANPGDGAHGQLWGILPALGVPIRQNRLLSTHFRVGTGLCRVQRPYSYFDNPNQNALGSAWNALVQFRLESTFFPQKPWQLRLGAGLTHVSNGGSRLPNYGINLPFVSAGIGKTVVASKVAESAPNTPLLSKSLTGQRRWGGQAHFGLCRIEHNSFDGPRYRVWQAGAGLFRLHSRTQRSGLGLDWEYNEAIRALRLHLGGFVTDAEARRGSTRVGIQATHEFLFGDLSIALSGGRYVGPASINRFVLSGWYTKLGVRYYAPVPRWCPLRPYVGAALKSHLAIAEYISTNVGLAF